MPDQQTGRVYRLLGAATDGIPVPEISRQSERHRYSSVPFAIMWIKAFMFHHCAKTFPELTVIRHAWAESDRRRSKRASGSSRDGLAIRIFQMVAA